MKHKIYLLITIMCFFLFIASQAQTYVYYFVSGTGLNNVPYNETGVFKCTIDLVNHKIKFIDKKYGSYLMQYRNKRDSIINNKKYIILNTSNFCGTRGADTNVLITMSSEKMLIYDYTLPKKELYLTEEYFKETNQTDSAFFDKKYTKLNTNESIPSNNAKSIEYFEQCIINGIQPNKSLIDNAPPYQSDFRVLTWNEPLIKLYKYSDEALDKLGYDIVKSDYKDKRAYRNCAKGILIEVGEYNPGGGVNRLIVTMTWFGGTMKRQNKYFMFCK